jgi:hypothetical protein
MALWKADRSAVDLGVVGQKVAPAAEFRRPFDQVVERAVGRPLPREWPLPLIRL